MANNCGWWIRWVFVCRAEIKFQFWQNLIYSLFSLRLSSDSARKELISQCVAYWSRCKQFLEYPPAVPSASLSRKFLRLPTKSSRQITEACRILRVLLSVIWWWHKMFVWKAKISRLIFNVLFSAPPPDAKEHPQLLPCFTKNAAEQTQKSQAFDLSESVIACEGGCLEVPFLRFSHCAETSAQVPVGKENKYAEGSKVHASNHKIAQSGLIQNHLSRFPPSGCAISHFHSWYEKAAQNIVKCNDEKVQPINHYEPNYYSSAKPWNRPEIVRNSFSQNWIQFFCIILLIGFIIAGVFKRSLRMNYVLGICVSITARWNCEI